MAASVQPPPSLLVPSFLKTRHPYKTAFITSESSFFLLAKIFKPKIMDQAMQFIGKAMSALDDKEVPC